MKRIIIISSFLLLITSMLVLNSCESYVDPQDRATFENSMVKALGLKLVLRDSEHLQSRLQIYNDTLVGFYIHKRHDTTYKYYFFQGLSGAKTKIEFNNFDLTYPSISNIDAYRNGCLYFGKYGLSTMQSLCSDGKLTEYFKKYQDTLFYADKVMLFKNKAVISSENGMYVFDMISQKLLWSSKWIDDSPSDGLSTVINDKLFFTKRQKGFTNVICYDLQKMKINWMTKIDKDADYIAQRKYVPTNNIPVDGSNIVLTEQSACYTLNMNSGIITGKMPYEAFHKSSSYGPVFKVDSGKIYINDSRDNKLNCIDMKTNKIIWKVTNAFFWGIYKNYVIATSRGLKYYVIISKQSGTIIKKIIKPESTQMDFDFIDNYILINGQSLYK